MAMSNTLRTVDMVIQSDLGGSSVFRGRCWKTSSYARWAKVTNPAIMTRLVHSAVPESFQQLHHWCVKQGNEGTAVSIPIHSYDVSSALL